VSTAPAGQADRHKRAPVTWRPAEDLEKQLRAHAAARGESVGSVLARAVTLLLAEESAKNP
jgi:hypothetical protein